MDIVNRGSTVTTAGFRLFTPAYAAPELQSDNSVGVFTDIYSMGVILYELITGSVPFPNGAPNSAYPQRPSQLTESADINEGLTLSKSEWADIDAICMKTLDQESEKRYGSMDAMILDIDAFLNDRPLSTRKTAVIYTMRKFLRRNRLAVLSVALSLFILVAGTVLFTVRLSRARDTASRARDEALAEAARSARLERFTESLFTAGAGYGIPPPGVKVTQMLDRGRAEALALTSDPRLQADMFQTLGSAYANLDRFADAEPLLRNAQQEVCKSGASLQCADIDIRLGLAISSHGSLKESQSLIEDALRIKKAKLPTNDLMLAPILVELATITRRRGQYEKSKPLYDQALAIASASGRSTPQLAAILAVYAIGGLTYNDPRALQYEERSAQINQQLYGTHSAEHALNELYFGDSFRAQEITSNQNGIIARRSQRYRHGQERMR